MTIFSTISCTTSRNNTFLNISNIRNKNYRTTHFTGSVGKFIEKKQKQKKKIAKEVVKRITAHATKKLKTITNKNAILKFKNTTRQIKKPVFSILREKKIQINLIIDKSTVPHNGCKKKKNPRKRK